MRLTELVASVTVVTCCFFGSAHAQISAELLDLAARVQYGFYHGDARAIDAAETSLKRLDHSPAAVYYRDFAALRRAQVGPLDRDGARNLGACVQRDAAPNLKGIRAAEAWVLVAACAFVGGDDKRVETALAAARRYDRDHPRIALIEAWMMQRRAGSDPARREALAAKLTEVVAAFDAWTASIDDPDWGHAEALAALAQSALDRGEVRAARDLIERALILAPGFSQALELRTAMQGARSGNRTL